MTDGCPVTTGNNSIIYIIISLFVIYYVISNFLIILDIFIDKYVFSIRRNHSLYLDFRDIKIVASLIIDAGVHCKGSLHSATKTLQWHFT